MDVLYWQILVVVSVLVAFLVKRSAAVFVCLAWTLWSLAMVRESELIIIQTIVAWGTFFILNSRFNSKQKIEVLRRASRKSIRRSRIPEKTKQIALQRIELDPDRFALVKGKNHRNVLQKSISSSKSSICILSGWIGSALLNRETQGVIIDALKRGVDLYIGYGWESDGKHIFSTPAEKAKKFIDFNASRHLGKIHQRVFPTHEKSLVIDDAFVIFGSNNWLSNDKFSNHETSVIIRDTKLASDERDRIVATIGSGESNSFRPNPLRGPA